MERGVDGLERFERQRSQGALFPPYFRFLPLWVEGPVGLRHEFGRLHLVPEEAARGSARVWGGHRAVIESNAWRRLGRTWMRRYSQSSMSLGPPFPSREIRISTLSWACRTCSNAASNISFSCAVILGRRKSHNSRRPVYGNALPTSLPQARATGRS